MQNRRSLLLGLAYTAIITLAMGVLYQDASLGARNFSSDEALMALRGQHLTQGRAIPSSVRSDASHQHGTLFSVLMTPFMHVMGPTVAASRACNLTLMALFFILHAMLISHWFGHKVALTSLALLAVPSPITTEWIARFYFSNWALFGMAALTLHQLWNPKTPWKILLRFFSIGLLLGLGMWAMGQTIIYATPILLCLVVDTREWRRIHNSRIMPILSAILFLLAFFAIYSLNPKLAYVARIGFVAVVTAGSGLLVYASDRRQWFLTTWSSLVLGAGIGFLPRIIGFISSTSFASSSMNMYTWTPSWENSYRFFMIVLPELVGIPSKYPFVRLGLAEAGYWVCLILILASALTWFAFRYRKGIYSRLALRPSGPHGQRIGIILLLILIPSVGLLCRHTLNEGHVRYMLTAWQSGTVVLAMFFIWASKRWKPAGIVLAGFLLVWTNARWESLSNRLTHTQDVDNVQAIADLENYLQQSNASVGYADYWTANRLIFLSQERIILTPFWGLNAFPEYESTVLKHSVHAYILHQHRSPVELDAAPTIENLIAGMNLFVRGKRKQRLIPGIEERLAGQHILERKQIAPWDIWIVSNKSREGE